MKILVAGATGAVGLPLVRMLRTLAHQVTSMTRADSHHWDNELRPRRLPSIHSITSSAWAETPGGTISPSVWRS
jgi:NAD dependent epimerase/dehydratase family enzyme